MRIAINGVGVAGPTLAYWLREFGHEPVLFEKAPALRTGGYIIDFWGLGYEIAEKMGLMPQLRERAYPMQRMSMVDAEGNEVAAVDVEPVRELLDGRYFSVARGDLAAAIFRACGDAPTHFGVSVNDVEQDASGVTATLSNADRARFDLLVGADGLHSRVREVIAGPEAEVERHLDCYIAAFRIHGYPHRDELTYVSHTVRGRQAARFSLRDDATLVMLVCRSELLEDAPLDEPRAALRHAFGDMEWEVPALLDHMDEAEDLYFDRVSQIRLPRWSDGRVALIGDAAACASPMAGEGTGLAMIEAYVLAGELHRAGGDHARGFAAYEERLRDFVAHKQKAALRYRGFFAPKSRFSLALRTWGLKAASLSFVQKLVTRRLVRDNLELPDYTA